MFLSIIATIIPGMPDPDPKSVVVLQLKSTKSMICAESIICLSLMLSFWYICLLIKFISWFFSLIIEHIIRQTAVTYWTMGVNKLHTR